MEHYAEIMELNIWLESTIERNPQFDAQTKTWTVKVNRKTGQDRTLKVHHLILATGFSGEPRLPTFPMEEFKGVIHHSSQHPGCAGQGWEGKKAIVVGCCNSGSVLLASPVPLWSVLTRCGGRLNRHDIAADFCESGLDTTMVQRSHTYFVGLLDEFAKSSPLIHAASLADEFETRYPGTFEGSGELFAMLPCAATAPNIDNRRRSRLRSTKKVALRQMMPTSC